jgi:transposase InsO family protein
MLVSYQKANELLRGQLKSLRDRDVRIKVNLILLACKLQNVEEACARRGFSRKFFYKWYGRLRRGKWNLLALREESRRPRKRHPKKISPALEGKIRYQAKLGFGSPSIQAILARQGIKIARSTISHVLRYRKKQVAKRRKDKLKSHRRRYELPIPGMRVQVDVKYVPEFVEGFRAYNFVAVDECTRMRFAYAYLDLKPENTVDFLRRMKSFFPFDIHTVQTDNGFEFTNRLIPTHQEVEHEVDRWCRENNVRHRCIPPGEKELNGKVERSHRIDEQFFYWRAPTENLERFNQAFASWLIVYNHERLHGGLGFITPVEKLWSVYEANRKREVPDLNILKDLPKRFLAYKEALRLLKKTG